MNFWNWLFHRKAREEDLEEEVQAHLRMAARERTEQGETAEQARASVVREFGNVLLVKEIARDMWGFRRLETFVAASPRSRALVDCRFGFDWRINRLPCHRSTLKSASGV